MVQIIPEVNSIAQSWHIWVQYIDDDDDDDEEAEEEAASFIVK